MDQRAFLGVFAEILAPDTQRVKAATATLRSDYYPLPESLTILLQLLLSNEPSPLRQLAATQAKTLVSKHWKKLPPAEKAQYRQKLLEGTLHEEEQIVRHAASRVVTAVAKIDLEDGEWKDIFDVLLRAAMSSSVREREVGTYLLFTCLEGIGEVMMPRFQELLGVFGRTIEDSESAEVRINTMLGLSRLAIVLDTENDTESLKALQDAIPQMVAVLKGAVDAGDEDRTTQSFEVFQTLLGCDSSVLNKHFGDLVQFMSNLAAQKTLDDEARTQAISFLMQCVRFRKLKMQALKVGEQLTLKCLEIVTEMGDAASVDDEEVTTARGALGLIDEMASSLPPSQVVVPLLHALGPYVNSPDPDRRQAGILALGTCVEGAPDFIETQLSEIFPLVLRLLEDKEVKVRRAALDGVMRIAEDLPQELAKEHEKLLPALVNHLDMALHALNGAEDAKNLDIIRAICNCIDALFEGLEDKDTKRYLPELMRRMVQLFEIDDFKTKGAAISATGAMAASSKKEFMPYFKETMSKLQNYVQMKNSPEELDLRAVTCDAMGNMAMAVGPKAFQGYVRPLMTASEEGLNLEHPKLKETSFLFWGQMAKVYEDEFKPFLPGVVKTLFECLDTEESDLEVDLGEEGADLAGKEITIGGKKIKVAAMSDDDIVAADEIEDLDEEIADGDDDWDDMDVVSAVAQEKEIAVEVLGDILSHATQDYLPYMEKTIETILPLVEHSYEGVQKAALSTLFRAYSAVWDIQPEELREWKAGLPLQSEPSQQIKKLGELIMTAALMVWQEEEDRATVTDINRNIAASLKATGPSLIADPSRLKHITEILLSILAKTHACQKDYGDEEDLGQLEETSEYDWLTIDTAMDVICGLASALGPTFSQLWKMFEKPIMKFASGSESFERSTAVGVIAECIKGMGAEVTPSTSTLMTLLLKRMTDEDPEAKSNAAYAMGLLQLHSTNDREVLKSFPTILSRLEPLLQMREARAMDNAAGCVSRMVMRHPDKVPVAQVLPALLDILPLRNDFDENEPVYDMIVGLYQKNEPTIVSLTPRLLPVLAEVMAPEPEDQLKDSTREKLVQLVKYVASKQPAEVRKYEDLAALV